MPHPKQGILAVTNCDCRNLILMTGWEQAGGDSSHHHRQNSNCSGESEEFAECGGGDDDGDSGEYGGVAGDR
jgi:hypothetical protein